MFLVDTFFEHAHPLIVFDIAPLVAISNLPLSSMVAPYYYSSSSQDIEEGTWYTIFNMCCTVKLFLYFHTYHQ